MSDKKLVILGILAAVLAAAAILQSGKSGVTASKSGETRLLQGIDVGKIASIQLGSGVDVVTLDKKGDGFVVKDKNNYPAHIAKINTLLTSVLDVWVLEVVTTDPGNYEDLEVTEEKASNVVKFLDENGELIVGLIIGKRNYENGESFVRKLVADEAESSKVYMARNAPWLQMGAMSYIQKELFKVETADIAKVTVTGGDGAYTIAQTDGMIELQDVPEGKEVKKTDCEAVFNAVNELTFTDVKAAADEDVKGLVFDRSFVCELADSTICTFKVAEKGSKYYVMCSAAFGDTAPVKMDRNKKDTDEELKAKEAKLLAMDAAKEFQQKHDGWVYEVAGPMAQKMIKAKSELLEDKAAETATEAEATPMAAIPAGS